MGKSNFGGGVEGGPNITVGGPANAAAQKEGHREKRVKGKVAPEKLKKFKPPKTREETLDRPPPVRRRKDVTERKGEAW